MSETKKVKNDYVVRDGQKRRRDGSDRGTSSEPDTRGLVGVEGNGITGLSVLFLRLGPSSDFLSKK